MRASAKRKKKKRASQQPHTCPCAIFLVFSSGFGERRGTSILLAATMHGICGRYSRSSLYHMARFLYVTWPGGWCQTEKQEVMSIGQVFLQVTLRVTSKTRMHACAPW